MPPNTEAQIGQKNRRDDHCQKIVQFLYDEGPSTARQIAEHLELSVERTNELMALARASGDVTTFKRGPNFSPDRITYWILAKDA